MAPRIAVVAYQGVLADESHAFRDVFRRVPDAEVVTVGERIGIVAGPGGAQVVAATFRDVGRRRRRRRAGRPRQPPPQRDRLVDHGRRADVGRDELDRLGAARRGRAAARTHGRDPLARPGRCSSATA